MNRSIAFLGVVALGTPGCSVPHGPGADSPDIRATPVSLEFGEVAVGERAEQTVRLDNPAEGTLLVRELRLDAGDARRWQLSWNTENEPTTAHPVPDPAEGHTFDPVLAIEPGGEFFLFAAYAPLDDASVSGALVLTTNVVSDFEFEIPLQVGRVVPPPALTVTPAAFDFGRVAPIPAGSGEPVPFAEFTVENAGGETLYLAGLTLSGSSAFTPQVDGLDPRSPSGAGVLGDPDADGVAGLGPGAHFVVEVHYAPTAQAPESAVPTLESNDPARPAVTVELRAQGD